MEEEHKTSHLKFQSADNHPEAHVATPNGNIIQAKIKQLSWLILVHIYIEMLYVCYGSQTFDMHVFK